MDPATATPTLPADADNPSRHSPVPRFSALAARAGHTRSYDDLLGLLEAAPVYSMAGKIAWRGWGSSLSSREIEAAGGVEAVIAQAVEQAGGGGGLGGGAGDPAAIGGDADTIIERQLLAQLQVDVLGELENGHVLAFAGFHRKLAEVDLNRLPHSKLQQHFGPPVKEFVWDGRAGDAPEGTHALKDVLSAIGLVAGYHRIDDDRIAGSGCWSGLNEKGERDGTVVIVGAGRGGVVDTNGKLKIVEHPKCGGRMLSFANSDDWCDFQALQVMLDNYSQQFAEQAINDATNLFSKWAWRHQETAPDIMVGLVLATWVQTIWSWRPQVEITGASNTGKSTLFKVMEAIFGNLAEVSSKSSAAGLRQTIQKTGKIILNDEFEHGKHRPEILEMIRAASRGDSIIMGTASQRQKKFVVRHIFWLSAIEAGLDKAADRNRFISLEVIPPPAHLAGKLREPPKAEMENLGLRLLAVAVRNAARAREMAIALKEYRHAKVEQRVVESYAVPASMIAAVSGDSEAIARETLEEMLQCVSAEDQRVSDEDDLMHAILRSNIRLGPSDEQTVASLIRSTLQSSRDALERYGLAITYPRRGRPATDWFGAKDEHLFIDHRDVIAKLLSRGNSDWNGKSIDRILKRIDGAYIRQATVGGRRTLGIWIPMEYVKNKFLNDGDEGEKHDSGF